MLSHPDRIAEDETFDEVEAKESTEEDWRDDCARCGSFVGTLVPYAPTQHSTQTHSTARRRTAQHTLRDLSCCAPALLALLGLIRAKKKRPSPPSPLAPTCSPGPNMLVQSDRFQFREPSGNGTLN